MDFGRPTEVVLRDLEKIRMRGGFLKRDFEREEEPGVDLPGKELGAEKEELKVEEAEPKEDVGVAPNDPLAKVLALAKMSKKEEGGGNGGGGVKRSSVRPAISMSKEVVDPRTLAAECDFNSGLILAGDILHRFTSKKRCNRKIYLITDGESRERDTSDHDKRTMFRIVLDSLKQMGVELSVIGLDFKLGFGGSGGTVKAKDRTATEKVRGEATSY